MDREAVEKLAMDLEEKRVIIEILDRKLDRILTQYNATCAKRKQAYAAFLTARNKYLDAVV